MIKVVIVEDEVLVADHLATILSKHKFNVVATAENLKEAESTLALSPDLFLLDIRLSEIESGINFGAKLQKLAIPFVYITANNEIEVLREAIKTEPEAYITKPFNERDVIAAVELVNFKMNNEKSISIITNKGIEKLLEKDILYCKADGVYTDIITENQSITQRVKLKELEDKLSNNFIRIHRSYIINKTKISSRKANSIFIGQMELPVSRSYKKDLSE